MSVDNVGVYGGNKVVLDYGSPLQKIRLHSEDLFTDVYPELDLKSNNFTAQQVINSSLSAVELSNIDFS